VLTARGFNVATIKQTSHAYSIDTPGKDTWQHAQAGAGFVCFHSSVETSFMIKDSLSYEHIKKFISLIEDIDIVLVEGAKEKDLMKIRLDDHIEMRDNTVFTYDGDINKVIVFIDKQRNEK
jgi:molybdopterin-guanine dinucleotide biosynthesis protein B